ncbi:histidine triad nucleotide-binding protein [Nocardioides coralli]|uniref:histidine triad nucleotide-binding protein n=1 Tax=Nocardioides coralli TaxID=2872154 RepID=UPI001CA3ECB0|nr:histidine triad nucleotide-binding protein [Nocardioides coralli]QZY30269.1 histidine triad nucleotide-binding protein [Nocardioides coralli]
MTGDEDCVFCKIVSGEIPGDVVLSTDEVVAFRDLQPVAPTHVLVVPRAHAPDAAATAADDPALLGALVSAGAEVARQEGVSDYRLVLNTGAEAGQSVFHTHLHVLGGRAFSWPPG